MSFDLNVAGGGLMVYDGIPLSVGRDAATPDNFVLHFRADSLAWQNAGERRKSELSVMVVSFDKKGKVLTRSAHIMTLDLPALPAGATTDDRLVNHACNSFDGNAGGAAAVRGALQRERQDRCGECLPGRSKDALRPIDGFETKRGSK